MTKTTERYPLARWRPYELPDLLRLGTAGDGGYVIPRRCVDGSTHLFGFGIDRDWSFESEFLRANPRVAVTIADGAVSPRLFMDRCVEAGAAAVTSLLRLRRHNLRSRFEDAKRWRALTKDLVAFTSRDEVRLVSRFLATKSGPHHVTWRELLADSGAARRDAGQPHIFVKLDIEGDEYRVLDDVLVDAGRLTGLAIEFHDCDRYWDLFSSLMDRLSETFFVAHVHGNNCRPLIRHSTTPEVLEVSFVHKALAREPPLPTRARPLPGLDHPNNPHAADFAITFSD